MAATTRRRSIELVFMEMLCWSASLYFAIGRSPTAFLRTIVPVEAMRMVMIRKLLAWFNGKGLVFLLLGLTSTRSAHNLAVVQAKLPENEPDLVLINGKIITVDS